MKLSSKSGLPRAPLKFSVSIIQFAELVTIFRKVFFFVPKKFEFSPLFLVFLAKNAYPKPP